MDDEQSIREDAEQDVIGEYGQPRAHRPLPGTITEEEGHTHELLDSEPSR